MNRVKREFVQLIPQTMKRTVWLFPLCIMGVTLGIFMLLFAHTDMDPELSDRISRRGGTEFCTFFGLLNILCPVWLLWFHSDRSEKIARGEIDEMEEDD